MFFGTNLTYLQFWEFFNKGKKKKNVLKKSIFRGAKLPIKDLGPKQDISWWSRVNPNHTKKNWVPYSAPCWNNEVSNLTNKINFLEEYPSRKIKPIYAWNDKNGHQQFKLNIWRTAP